MDGASRSPPTPTSAGEVRQLRDEQRYARQESNLRHATSKGSGSSKNALRIAPRVHDGTTDVDALEKRVVEALQAFATGSPTRERIAVEALGGALELLGELRTPSRRRPA